MFYFQFVVVIPVIKQKAATTRNEKFPDFCNAKISTVTVFFFSCDISSVVSFIFPVFFMFCSLFISASFYANIKRHNTQSYDMSMALLLSIKGLPFNSFSFSFFQNEKYCDKSMDCRCFHFYFKRKKAHIYDN